MSASPLKPRTFEEACRIDIATLLTRRCTNCYSMLPGWEVHGVGWHWVTSDVGPFCNDCWQELTKQLEEVRYKLLSMKHDEGSHVVPLDQVLRVLDETLGLVKQ